MIRELNKLISRELRIDLVGAPLSEVSNFVCTFVGALRCQILCRSIEVSNFVKLICYVYIVGTLRCQFIVCFKVANFENLLCVYIIL